MLPFVDNMMSSFLSAYRLRYSTQHVLLQLIKQWRDCLDNNKVVGGNYLWTCQKPLTVSLMTLLIAKLEAYTLGRSSLSLLM